MGKQHGCPQAYLYVYLLPPAIFGVVEAHTQKRTPTRVDGTCPSGYINFYMENGKERFFNGHVLVEIRFKNLWDFRRIVQKKLGEIPD